MTKNQILTGDAFFTFGQHSYRVYQNSKGQHVVCCFVGSDKASISHYLVLGVLDIETGEVTLTCASRFLESDECVKTIKAEMLALWTVKAEPETDEKQIERLLNDKRVLDIIETVRAERVCHWLKVGSHYFADELKAMNVCAYGRWSDKPRSALIRAGYDLRDGWYLDFDSARQMYP